MENNMKKKHSAVGDALLYAIKVEIPYMLNNRGPWSENNPFDDDFIPWNRGLDDVVLLEADDETDDETDEDFSIDETVEIPLPLGIGGGIRRNYLSDRNRVRSSHFYAVINYLFFEGYLKEFDLCRILLTFSRFGVRYYEDEEKAERLLSVIIRGISSKIHFKDRKELITELNKAKLEPWHFYLSYSVVNNYNCEICRFGDSLYYIADKDKGGIFYKIKIDDIRSYNPLEGGAGRTEIMAGLTSFRAVDKERNLIVLSSLEREGMYYTYAVGTDNITIHEGRFFDYEDGKNFVFRRGNLILVRPDGSEKVVDEERTRSRYDRRDNYYLVEPTTESSPFFEPYRITLDGEIEPASKEERIEIIWPIITRALSSEAIGILYEKTRIPETITYSSIMKFRKSLEDEWEKPEDTPELTMYNEMLTWMEMAVRRGYLKENEDLMDFFIICLKNNNMREAFDRDDDDMPRPLEGAGFPTVRSFLMLRTFFYTVLGKSDGSESFTEQFLRFANETEEEIAGMLSKKSKEGPDTEDEDIFDFKIGHFSFKSGNKLVGERFPLSEGLLLGKCCIPKIITGDYRGFVSYDYDRDCVFINTYDKELTPTQKERIIRFFNLRFVRKVYMIHTSSGISEGEAV